jgi:hypothetical protein
VSRRPILNPLSALPFIIGVRRLVLVVAMVLLLVAVTAILAALLGANLSPR